MAFESGIRPQRLGFVRETSSGITPTNPTWLAYSNTVQSTSPTPEVTISERRSVGQHDVLDFSAGSETHQYEINYDLQSWFEVSAGVPLDAAYDGMFRRSNGEIFNTHSILQRDLLGGAGAAGGGSRMYTVVTGAKIGSVNISAEPESGEPMNVTLSYMAEKMRSYRVDQPLSATTLQVRSTSAADTTQTVTIESDGAATTETVTLNGVTPVATTATFATIDAIKLSAQTTGDVIVSDGVNDLAILYGKAAYGNREGDLGIPLLGSGSHPAPISGNFYYLLGDTITRDGNPIMNNVDISSVQLTVDNSLDPQASHKTIGRRINEGDRNVTIAATVYGNSASYDTIVDHLRVIQADIVWSISGGGSLTFPGACLMSPGSVAKETSMATMTIDNTFTSKGITITTV
jgi:hypothetical protein